MTAATGRNARYTMRKPCPKCPFRTDVDPYLRPERAQEIAQGLRGGGEFACHATTVRVEDDNGDTTMVDDPDRSRFCAGALATMEREGMPNQMMRIAERLGLYNPADRDAAALPVSRSLTEWVRRHYTVETAVDPGSGDVIEFEHCGVVGEDCEDPAGYGGYSGAYANDDPPTCDPLTDECAGCARPVCPACRSKVWGEPGHQYCVNCLNPDEEYADD